MRKYVVTPGEATLLAAANISDDGYVEFQLTGARFGRQWGDQDVDEQLWSALEALAVKYGQNFGVVATVGDPDFVTGAPGSPGTFLPADYSRVSEAPASDPDGLGNGA